MLVASLLMNRIDPLLFIPVLFPHSCAGIVLGLFGIIVTFQILPGAGVGVSLLLEDDVFIFCHTTSFILLKLDSTTPFLLFNFSCRCSPASTMAEIFSSIVLIIYSSSAFRYRAKYSFFCLLFEKAALVIIFAASATEPPAAFVSISIYMKRDFDRFFAASLMELPHASIARSMQTALQGKIASCPSSFKKRRLISGSKGTDSSLGMKEIFPNATTESINSTSNPFQILWQLFMSRLIIISQNIVLQKAFVKLSP